MKLPRRIVRDAARRDEISWVSLIRTARVPYGLLVLIGAGLVLPPQMRDMLAALAEGRNFWVIAAFPASIAVFGFLCWYWARAAISARFDLPDTRMAWDEAVRRGRMGVRPFLREGPLHIVPQAPIPLAGLIGLAMAVQSGAYGLGVATLGALLAVWFLVDRRRRIRARLRRVLFPGRAFPEPELPREDRRLRSTYSFGIWLRRAPFRMRKLLQRAPSGKGPALLLLGLSVLVFLVTALASLWPAQRLDDPRNLIWIVFRGPTPVLLGGALIVGPLSALAFVLDGWRVSLWLRGAPVGFSRPPVLSGLILFGLLTPSAIDLHAVRVAPGELAARPSLEAAWTRWRTQCGTRTRPIVVGISGGASRAALWGMAVLAAVDRAAAGTDAAVFAVSTVSGGSLGAAGYLAVRAAGPAGRSGDPVGCRMAAGEVARFGAFARRLGSADAIGALLAGFVLSDVPRSLVAWLPASFGADLRGGDRAAAIERAFEANARGAGREAGLAAVPLDRPYLRLARADLPIWIGNATDRDSGERALVSPVDGAGSAWPFQGAADVLAQLGRDMPISTAVNATARFPLLEPSGNVSRDGGIALSLIDGGYYDQSGLETALELAEWLRRQGANPVLVEATGAGFGNGLGPQAMRGAEDEVVRCGGPPFRPGQPHMTATIADVLAPIVGLYESRAGHVDALLRRAQYEYCDPHNVSFFHFYLGALGDEPVPLNWVLSQRMATHVWVSAGNEGGGAESGDIFVQGNLCEAARLHAVLARGENRSGVCDPHGR